MPKQQSTREAISDGVITAKVNAALVMEEITIAHEIHVDTHASIVRLTGFVNTVSVRDTVLRLAQNVTGVRGVDDLLDIRQTH
jgi:hyperosmotically inducible periplasmic protein